VLGGLGGLEQLRSLEDEDLAGAAGRRAARERDRCQDVVAQVHELAAGLELCLLLPADGVGFEDHGRHVGIVGRRPAWRNKVESMLALLNGDPPRLVHDQPSPSRPAGEALLRPRLSGICDTDLQLARGYMGFRGVLGHEMVADVVECDDARWRGRRVVADINASCGECRDCRESDGHHCASRTVLGILERNGSLAEELVVPERCLVQVPDGVPDELAVFAEPMAAALHVLDELPSPAAGSAVVLGDGKLGLLVTFALASAGLDVTLVGHHRDKLALGAAAGARGLLESEVSRTRDRASVVVEATGSASGLALALELTAPKGLVVLKTTVAGPTQVDLSPIVINELRVVGSRCGHLDRALDVLAAGRVDPRPLITARYPLARADEALAHAARKGALKVLVEGGRD
jgi:threonine dehydrogenase-like Zn-dependent dehydrogenase